MRRTFSDLLEELHDASEAMALFESIEDIAQSSATREWIQVAWTIDDETALHRMVERDMLRIAKLAAALGLKYQRRSERAGEALEKLYSGRKLPHKAPPKGKKKATAKVASVLDFTGGEGGIRTHGTGLPYA